MSNVQIHRAVNKLTAISILMSQYDPPHKKAWAMVGRLARQIQGVVIGDAVPTIGERSLYLVDKEIRNG